VGINNLGEEKRVASLNFGLGGERRGLVLTLTSIQNRREGMEGHTKKKVNRLGKRREEYETPGGEKKRGLH